MCAVAHTLNLITITQPLTCEASESAAAFHPCPRATAEIALLKHSMSAASAARASSSTVRAACQLRARSHAESAVPNDVVSGLSPSALIAPIKRSAAFQLRAAAAAASAAL